MKITVSLKEVNAMKEFGNKIAKALGEDSGEIKFVEVVKKAYTAKLNLDGTVDVTINEDMIKEAFDLYAETLVVLMPIIKAFEAVSPQIGEQMAKYDGFTEKWEEKSAEQKLFKKFFN